MEKLILCKTSTCPACRRMGALLLAEKIPHEIANVETDIETRKKYNVTSVPTLVKLKDDGSFETLTGFRPLNEIKLFIEGKDA